MSTKSIRQAIWSMPQGEDADRLQEIAVKHTRFALEAISRKTTDSRKQEINRCINDLRAERDAIIAKYQ